MISEVMEKTHSVTRKPRIALNQLAEYMIASDVTRQRILTTCRFRPIARIVQYNDGRSMVAFHIASGSASINDLQIKLDKLARKPVSSGFEAQQLELNCALIAKYIALSNVIELPGTKILKPPLASEKLKYNGVEISVEPDLIVMDKKDGQALVGAAKIRYSKGKPVDAEAAEYVGVGLFDFAESCLGNYGLAAKKLCFSLDLHSGQSIACPSSTTRKLNNMKAACAGIAAQWERIKPPNGAAL